MPTNNSKKYKYIIFLLVIIIIALVVCMYWPHGQSAPTQTSDTSTNLPDIPAPAGWQIDRTNSSQIIFTESSTGAFPNRIEVDALKMYGSLDQQIAHDYTSISGNATSSNYIGWSGMRMTYGGNSIPVGWATINGNLILVSNDKNTDTETTLDYSIFNNGVVYMFSTNYQQYNPTTKQFETINPASIQTIQMMVQNFAESLPSGASQ